jgi:hypothetical protein
MHQFLPVFALALYGGVLYLVVHKKFARRIRTLEQDLQSFHSVMSQMAEIQAQTYRKLSANLEGIEERMMELSVPSQNSNLPLERRHQVLTLARQGLALEDIAKRLKAPIGEAELILSLGKYMETDKPRAIKTNEQVGQHA